MSIATLVSTPVEFSTRQKAWLAVGAVLSFCVLLFAAEMAMAGTVTSGGYSGTALDSVWQMLTEFVEGPIGRIITLLIIVVGVAAGILTQSLGAFAVGVGAALGLSFAPEIINGLLGATLEAGQTVVTHVVPVMMQLTPLVGA